MHKTIREFHPKITIVPVFEKNIRTIARSVYFVISIALYRTVRYGTLERAVNVTIYVFSRKCENNLYFFILIRKLNFEMYGMKNIFIFVVPLVFTKIKKKIIMVLVLVRYRYSYDWYRFYNKIQIAVHTYVHEKNYKQSKDL